MNWPVIAINQYGRSLDTSAPQAKRLATDLGLSPDLDDVSRF
jgi:hypothetical protein